jgi:hypothetical protein
MMLASRVCVVSVLCEDVSVGILPAPKTSKPSRCHIELIESSIDLLAVEKPSQAWNVHALVHLLFTPWHNLVPRIG